MAQTKQHMTDKIVDSHFQFEKSMYEVKKKERLKQMNFDITQDLRDAPVDLAIQHSKTKTKRRIPKHVPYESANNAKSMSNLECK